jgi:hypothetical protein
MAVGNARTDLIVRQDEDDIRLEAELRQRPENAPVDVCGSK